MDEENQQRIDADPKIRELKQKIEEARMRSRILEATTETDSGSLENKIPEAPSESQINPLPSLRTFESDTREAIRDKKESLVSIKIAETRRHGSPVATASRALSLYISIALIIAGFSALAVIYYWESHPKTVVTVVESGFLIQSSFRKDIDISTISRKNFAANLWAEEGSAATGSIVGFNLKRGATGKVDTAGMFQFIAPTTPSALVRAFGPLFDIGFYKGETTGPFIVINVASFDNAFAGMLSWEISMPQDLAEIITPTSTSSGVFLDEVVKNKDTRVWHDDSGHSLLYSFVDKNTLVITTDKKTFSVILNKLTATKFIR